MRNEVNARETDSQEKVQEVDSRLQRQEKSKEKQVGALGGQAKIFCLNDCCTVRCSLFVNNVRENSSSFAVHKLLVGSAGPKTVATPVDSLATGFDLAVYRRRMVEVLGTAGEEHVINIRRT